MKAVSEVGFTKAFKFLVYSFIFCVYDILVLPPFRKYFLILLGSKIGSDTMLMHVKFFNWQHTGPAGVKIGRECFIGDETLIDLYDRVVLEDQVTIAQRVTILTHINVGYTNHPLQKQFPKESKPVVIKQGSVISASSTILPGVTIGEESLVAAGSVVTEDVPAHTLVAGVPAKIVRKIK